MIPRYAFLVVGLLVLAHARADERTTAESRAEDLVGTYTITAGEKNGKSLPREHFEGVKVRIATNAITTFDKDKKKVYAATYVLDTKRKPWRIKMTATITADEGGKGTVAEGMIEKEGTTVKLIYALPKGSAPIGFKTGDKQQMFTLERSSK